MVVPASVQGRSRLWLVLLFAGFGTVFGLISLVNHYYFRTAALDYGMAAHALTDYARFRRHFSTLIIDSPPTDFLYAHFTLVPALVAPLHWLFGSWTLLLVQIAAVLAGGAGVYRYVQARAGSALQARLFTAYFFSIWGIYSALSYDYHDNVVGAMAVPWLLHWFGQGKLLRAGLAFLFLLISKENLALWGCFLMLGLALQHRKQPQARTAALLGAVTALVYFFLITKLVMPSLDPGHRPYAQFGRYAHLGGSLEEIVRNVMLSPRLWVSLLFENTTGQAQFNYIKAEFWLMLLVSGGWAFVLRPWYLLMIIPLLAQKLFPGEPTLWGINYQYSVEFAALLPLAVWEVARKAGKQRQQLLSRASLTLTVLATVLTLYVRQSKWYSREQANFLQPRHYRSELDVPRLRAALRQVPAGAPLSSFSNLSPWLINRKALYHFPVLRDARYVALLKNAREPWPLTAAGYQRVIEKLRLRTDFRVRYEDDQFLLFERTQPPALPDEVLRP